MTTYHFSFAAEHWKTALEIEADRMETHVLDAEEIERERQVILEEISMYEDDPWDSLELETTSRYYRGFPYGRPILGTRESVASIDGEMLRAFYQRHYRPDNAVLVVAGDLGPEALSQIESCLGRARAGGHVRKTLPEPFAPPGGLTRVRHVKGRTARMLLALPAPAAEHPDYPAWRLLLSILGGARSSRLYRRLVDEGELCGSASADLTEMAGPGATLVSTEVLPGVAPEVVEERSSTASASCAHSRRATPSSNEPAASSWQTGSSRWSGFIIRRSWPVRRGGTRSTYPAEHLRGLLACEPASLAEVAERYLPDAAGEFGGVLGWSFSERREGAKSRGSARTGEAD